MPESLSELILRARALDEQGHPDDQVLWTRLRTLVAAADYVHPEEPAVGPLVQLRADLLTDEAYRASRNDDDVTAAGLHEEAAELYAAGGLTGRAVLARAAALLATAEMAPEDADATEARVTALTDAHASMVDLHEGASDELSPHQVGRLLRRRATALGLRLQTSGAEEHVAPVLAEVDLLQAHAARHEDLGQLSGAQLLRASTYAISGDLPGAVGEIDGLVDRLRTDGPAWHLPHALGLRGRLRLGLGEAEAAHKDLTEGLRLAAEWPGDTVDVARLHADLAEASMRLGRPDEALRHLTRSAEWELRGGKRMAGFYAYGNAAQLSLDLGRVEDCIALIDSLLTEPDIASGELNDRFTAQLRLTRARALHVGGDIKAATAEFVALAAESAGWEDDPGSHAMIASETAVLLGESGEFDRAREVAEQAVLAHDLAPRYEKLSNCLRELARLQAEQQGPEGLAGALAHLVTAGRIAEEARAAEHKTHGRSLESALAYEYGRVYAYAGEHDDALAAMEKALGLIGEVGRQDDRAGEWAECVRLAAVVESRYLERPADALARLDAAVSHLTALGHKEETESLTALAVRLRERG